MPLRRCNAAVRPAATARSAHRPHPPSAQREWLRSATRSDPVICRRRSRSRRRGCADTAPSCSLRHPRRRSSGRDCRTRAPSPGRSGRPDARRSHAGICPPLPATRPIPPALPCREDAAGNALLRNRGLLQPGTPAQPDRHRRHDDRIGKPVLIASRCALLRASSMRLLEMGFMRLPGRDAGEARAPRLSAMPGHVSKVRAAMSQPRRPGERRRLAC